MAFRAGRNQQEVFGAFLASPPKNETLVEVEKLIDWKVLRAIMAPVYKDASQGGRPGYDPGDSRGGFTRGGFTGTGPFIIPQTDRQYGRGRLKL